MKNNPKDMMEFANRMNLFQQQHPKTVAFAQEIMQQGIQEGTVVEMKVTEPNGKEYISNFRVTSDDMQTLEMLKNMQKR